MTSAQAAGQARAPVLVVRRGREQHVFLVGAEIRVGRNPSLELIFRTPRVSRDTRGLITSDENDAVSIDRSSESRSSTKAPARTAAHHGISDPAARRPGDRRRTWYYAAPRQWSGLLPGCRRAQPCPARRPAERRRRHGVYRRATAADADGNHRRGLSRRPRRPRSVRGPVTDADQPDLETHKDIRRFTQ